MPYDDLEETQRRQINGMVFDNGYGYCFGYKYGNDDWTLALSHTAFWKDSTLTGAGPCWQHPYNTQRVAREHEFPLPNHSEPYSWNARLHPRCWIRAKRYE